MNVSFFPQVYFRFPLYRKATKIFCNVLEYSRAYCKLELFSLQPSTSHFLEMQMGNFKEQFVGV